MGDIAWAVIRDSSSFLLKKRGVKKPFSTEPCNLTNRNAQRHGGLVNNKVVGISAAPDNKGFVLTTKRSKNAFRPAKAMVATTMKAGPRDHCTRLRLSSTSRDTGRAWLRLPCAVLQSSPDHRKLCL